MNHDINETIFPADPRITAYAFGELEGDELARIEAAVQADPELQAAVEELQAFGEELTFTLVSEKTDGEAGAYESAVVAKTKRRGLRIPFPVYYLATAAAACLAVVVWLQSEAPAPRREAMQAKRPVVLQAQMTPQTIQEVPAVPPSLAAADKASAPLSSLPAAPTDVRVPVFSTKLMPVTTRGAPSSTQTVVAGALQPSVGGNVSTDLKLIPQGRNAGEIQASSRVATAGEFGFPPSGTSAAGMPSSVTLGGNVGYNTGTGIGSTSENVTSNGSGTGYMGQSYLGVISSRAEISNESYKGKRDNVNHAVAVEPLSTFSIDVDTASYSNVRRFLTGGHLPPHDAVRIEELVNYFPYDYAPPSGDVPFAAHLAVTSSPWAPAHRLVRIALKGREILNDTRPAANLVFLLDVSGSMRAANKLPLVKESLRLLVERLRDDDHVAIVTYANGSGLALPSTSAGCKGEILTALNNLRAGGSTNGSMGIQLAYDVAKANFVTGGINRVILCTDGDFNVGVVNKSDLVDLIQEKAKSRVFLSVFGFGMGNLKDSTLESLADKGNGAYGYIDTRREAEKVFVEQAEGTLATIAKDVKIQVEFNPARVQSYRLIGYENRMLKKEDFNNDAVDAGEVGAGHTVTALYEIVPVGVNDDGSTRPAVDPLKYQDVESRSQKPAGADSPELLTVKIRYKDTEGDVSKKLEFPLIDTGADFSKADGEFRFAAAVAAWGMLLRDSPHKGSATFDQVAGWAEDGLGNDESGYRTEFIQLVRRSAELSAR